MERYQDFMVRELNARIQKNPSYSLRALARDLRMTPAHLSSVLSGKKNVSRSKGQDIASVLSLSAAEKKLFLTMVAAEVSRGVNKEKLNNKIAELKKNDCFTEIMSAEVDVLTSWPYPVLFALFDFDDFEPNFKWITAKTGFNEKYVQKHIEIAESLGRIVRDESGWHLKDRNIATPTIPSAAIRRFHVQTMDNAKLALTGQTIEERDFSSVVMPIDPSRIKEAKDKLKDFRRSFFSEFSAGKNKSDVYCLSLQFFSALKTQYQQET